MNEEKFKKFPIGTKFHNKERGDIIEIGLYDEDYFTIKIWYQQTATIQMIQWAYFYLAVKWDNYSIIKQ